MVESRNKWWGRPPPRTVQSSEVKASWAIPTLLLALVLLTLILVLVFFLRPDVTRPAPNPHLQTRIQMKGMELAIRQYWHKYHEVPMGSVSNMLAVLAAENTDAQNPERIVFMKCRPPVIRFSRVVVYGDTDENGNYLDGWGRPFKIYNDVKKNQIVMKSYGPNGDDEQGRGDDEVILIVPDI